MNNTSSNHSNHATPTVSDTAASTASPHLASILHTQRSDGNANVLGELFENDLHSFSSYQQQPDTSQDEFMWDPSLFQNPSMYSSNAATQSPNWSQHAAAQSPDPPLPAYGSLQPSFQLGQYGSLSFDPRQPSHKSARDSHLIPQATTQYDDISQQVNVEYKALRYPNQQQFDLRSMVYPQPPPVTGPTFEGHSNPNPYFGYGSPMGGLAQFSVSCGNDVEDV
jgi:hypothetical protein